MNPKSVLAHLILGEAYFNLEEYEVAKSTFQQGLQLDPSHRQLKTWLRKAQSELDAELDKQEDETKKPETPTEKVEEKMKEQKEETKQTDKIVEQTEQQHEIVKLKNSWYQNTDFVGVCIYAKNVQKDDTTVKFSSRSFSISIKLPNGGYYAETFNLYDTIVPDQCTVEFTPSKVELSLKVILQYYL